MNSISIFSLVATYWNALTTADRETLLIKQNNQLLTRPWIKAMSLQNYQDLGLGDQYLVATLVLLGPQHNYSGIQS